MRSPVKLATVIILVYNNSQYLEKTIRSVVNQSYDNIEIIISDDCSSKNTENLEQMIELYGANPKFHFILNNKNVGTVKHINKVIAASKGDILCPLSCGDCFYDGNSLENIVKYFNNNDLLLVTAKRMCEINGSENFVLPKIKQQAIIKCQKRLFEYICLFNFISGASTYYRRELFEMYGLFDERYRLLEDAPYYIYLLSKNVAIGYLDNITISYQWGGVSTNKNIHPYLLQDYKVLNKEIWLKYGKIFKGWRRRVIKYRYMRSIGKTSRIIDKIKYIDVILILTLVGRMR